MKKNPCFSCLFYPYEGVTGLSVLFFGEYKMGYFSIPVDMDICFYYAGMILSFFDNQSKL